MPKEKFNPIAQLPTPPGAEITNDAPVVTNPQVEIRLKEVDPNKAATEQSASRRLLTVRTIILAILAVLVIFGIFLTFNFVPSIANKASNLSKSFTSVLITKNTATSTATSTIKTLVTIPPTATSTIKTTVTTPTTATPVTVNTATSTTIAYHQKSPARLLVGILSTNVIGNQTFVRFNVQNVGGSPSGAWSFSATLPSRMTPKYYSAIQNSIPPMGGIIYTLGFTADQYQYAPIQVTLYTNQGNVNSY